MVREEGEDPIHFADRCKRDIARAGGLVDRVWDGNLKVPNFYGVFKVPEFLFGYLLTHFKFNVPLIF